MQEKELSDRGNRQTMATTNLRRQPSLSSRESSEMHTVLNIQSSHWHCPFCTDALPDLAMVLPVWIEIIDTKRLFHPLSTCKIIVIK